MAKWTRVGDIPKKIPVNFVVDSDKYPALAAWIYSFPHGEMGKTVREILDAHAQADAGRVGANMTTDTYTRSAQGGSVDARLHEGQSGVATSKTAPHEDRPTSGGGLSPHKGQAGMDAGTANALNQLDQGF